MVPGSMKGAFQKLRMAAKQNERRNAIIGFPREHTVLANIRLKEFPGAFLETNTVLAECVMVRHSH